jgi:hypothetical protein
VNFGYATVANAYSYDQKTITVTVPYLPYMTNCYGTPCANPVGTFNVNVSNANGTSNNVSFTLTGSGNSMPVVSSLSPQSGPTGTNVTVFGSGFVTTGNNVQFGQTIIYNLSSYDGRTLSFTVPYLSNSCPPGAYCILGSTPVTPGQYNVVVSNANGTSNAMTFYVTSGQGSVSLYSISPSSGRVGTQISLYGSGFTQSGNDVHFGMGGIRNVASYDGRTITFTVPGYVSPCDFITAGLACAQVIQQITPGSAYQVYVSNANGQTNSLTFYVQ